MVQGFISWMAIEEDEMKGTVRIKHRRGTFGESGPLRIANLAPHVKMLKTLAAQGSPSHPCIEIDYDHDLGTDFIKINEVKGLC